MATRLDLLLINPSSRKAVYQSLGNSLSAIEPPVWAGLMAQFARLRGLSVAILDAEAEEKSPEEVAQIVSGIRPLLAAVVVYGHQPSASTQIMTAASSVTSAIKLNDPEQKVLLLGGHVAALPERTASDEVADFVCSGEGLVTLVELVEAFRANDTDWSKVSDLLWREGNVVMKSAKRAPLVQDVDREMPSVAWDLLPMNRYRAHNWHCLGQHDANGELARQPYVSIYTTLGCPYKCTFCCIQAPFKSGEAELGLRVTSNSYRFWSPRRVVDDLERLVNQYGVKNVKVADEMFVLNKRHVEGICDEIINRKLDLNIWAYARVDTVKDEMLPKLKAAGFNWLAFGIEAADEKVRMDVQKGFDQEEIFATIRKVWDHGIYVIGNYIFGLPEDDRSTMQKTLDLAIELNCEFANFYSAMAYPGSQLYQTALQNGWKLPETWNGYSQHAVDTLPLPTKYLQAGEVLRFRDEAFQTYNSSPRYLEMVEQKFGAPAVAHIRQMNSHRLERKYA